jgi:flagellin-like protein
MKANRKFIEGDEAVSAVIGVILMVAITVAIAATVYVYVSGMIGSGTQSTPNVSMTADPNDHNCTITIGTPTASDIEWQDVSFVLVDLTNAAEIADVASGSSATQAIIAPSTATYVAGGQIISITADGNWATTQLIDGHEYRFTLSYTQTGGSMGTVTWTQ